MNPCVTSKEAILQVCRSIVATEGLSALNMRTVADECHIALGTLYGYYSNKDDLLLSTIDSVWKDIFHMSQKCETDFPFRNTSTIFLSVSGRALTSMLIFLPPIPSVSPILKKERVGTLCFTSKKDRRIIRLLGFIRSRCS